MFLFAPFAIFFAVLVLLIFLVGERIHFQKPRNKVLFVSVGIVLAVCISIAVFFSAITIGMNNMS